jgi:F1F0 ATPase subunit 2
MDASPGGEAVMGVGIDGQIVIGLVAGLLVGGFHFWSLSWNTRLFTAGAAGKAIPLQLARIGVAVVALIALERLLGLAALLCGALGFLVARPLLLWRFGALR